MISPAMMQHFGTAYLSPDWYWDKKWIEEVDEEA
jgi:hypothetical protein